MRASEEYRERAVRGAGEVAGMLLDAADLIDAVAWAFGEPGPFSDAERMLAAYRASLRPAKPASGCEGCRYENGTKVEGMRFCMECSRCVRVLDRWEAKP